MTLRYVDDNSLQVGDIIFTKTTKWYIGLFCRSFGVDLPHVAVCIKPGVILDITNDNNVVIHQAGAFLDSNAYEVWRLDKDDWSCGHAEELRDDYVSRIMDTDIGKYSRVLLVKAMTNMIAGKNIFDLNRSNRSICTTFAYKVLCEMGLDVEGSAMMTPLDFNNIKEDCLCIGNY